ncbi:MAG TPA: hypothetical protein PKX92_05540 [Edaphocola sp.]|nr:hypothetical protein [Edaphocola sp.]
MAGVLVKVAFFNNDSTGGSASSTGSKEIPPASAPASASEQKELETVANQPKPTEEKNTQSSEAQKVLSNFETNNENQASSALEDQDDEINLGKIKSLLIAETNQDITTIKNSFASSGVRYWDMKNVSNDQVASKYFSTWEKATDFYYKIENADKVSKNKYLIEGYYNFYSYKNGRQTVYFKNVYIFNDYNKIVAAYSF